jgi:hypothetical protein
LSFQCLDDLKSRLNSRLASFRTNLFALKEVIDQLLIKMLHEVAIDIMVDRRYENGVRGAHNSHHEKGTQNSESHSYQYMYKSTYDKENSGYQHKG